MRQALHRRQRELPPPGAPGDPHTWLLPPSIGTFDHPGRVVCDTNSNIQGPDAVLVFDKTDPTSLLQVTITNTGNTATSDLDVQVATECDPRAPGALVNACMSNGDNHTLLVGGDAGLRWIWVTTESTSEPFGGATVEIVELAPGPGEACENAYALAAGANSVVGSSAEKYFAPSCLGAAIDVEWYTYTPTQGAISVASDTTAALGLVDATTGAELACVADASAGVTRVVSAGRPVCVAINPPTASTLTVTDTPYAGITDRRTLLPFTNATPTDLRQANWISASPTELYLGGDTWVGHMSKFDPRTFVSEHDAAGIGSGELGSDAVFVTSTSSLYALDDSNLDTANRVYRLYDGAQWGIVEWDEFFLYDDDSRAMTLDGTRLLFVEHTTTNAIVYSVDPVVRGQPTVLGSNDDLRNVTGIAADATWLYFAASVGGQEGIHRLRRTDLSNPGAVAETIALVDVDTSTTGRSAVFVDDYTSAAHLYFHADSPAGAHVIVDPGGATPTYMGLISPIGTGLDDGFAYDAFDNALYIIDSSQGEARLWRLDP